MYPKVSRASEGSVFQGMYIVFGSTSKNCHSPQKYLPITVLYLPGLNSSGCTKHTYTLPCYVKIGELNKA